MSSARLLSISALALLTALLTGCVSAPPKKALPYAWPEPAPHATEPKRPTAVVTRVLDHRNDITLDAALDQPLTEIVKRIVAAELTSEGIFSRVETGAVSASRPADIELSLELEDVSWWVPDYERKLQTAFWTSFLTGGIGGIAYGSSDTPVFGRATFSLRAARPPGGEALFKKRFQGVHEESMAKFSSDTPDTRLRMPAAALKKAMQAMRAELKSRPDLFLSPTAPAPAPLPHDVPTPVASTSGSTP